jgi:hypothetical protein
MQTTFYMIVDNRDGVEAGKSGLMGSTINEGD